MGMTYKVIYYEGAERRAKRFPLKSSKKELCLEEREEVVAFLKTVDYKVTVFVA